MTDPHPMTDRRPLNVAIIGMGGFAASHHDAIARLEAEGACRLVATCDPRMDAFGQRCTALRFAERGVLLFDDYIAMLDACYDMLDFVTIPTPVPLHAAMHRACVERELPVYLEKPPTLAWDELVEMLEVEKKASPATQVGFNFIVDPLRQAVKRRVAAGEFGRVLRASAFGLWPRDGGAYYRRAEWAGRLMLADRLVLDSPIGNALAHLVHNTLFWCGAEPMTWGRVESVEAELYRAHRIEGADTFFVRAVVDNGVAAGATFGVDTIEVRLGMTHACDGAHRQGEVVECERATIAFQAYARTDDGADCQHVTIRHTDGHVEEQREAGLHGVQDFLAAHFRAYGDYVAGRTARPLTRLEDCQPFVALNDLAYLAAGRIVTVPEEYIVRHQTEDGAGAAAPKPGEGKCGQVGGSGGAPKPAARKGEATEGGESDGARAGRSTGPSGYAAIAGIADTVEEFLASGRMPSQQNAPWAVPAGRATMADLPRLREVVAAMR